MATSLHFQKIRTAQLDNYFSTETPDPVKLVDVVIEEAVKLEASDVLFEPRQKNLAVRLRIDGVLHLVGEISLDIYSQVSSRIKVLSNLDLAEKRRIQEGQFIVEAGSAQINFRVEIAKTIYGELIVIRIHELRTIVLDVAKLGFSPKSHKEYQNMLKQRSGLILVCGPTGCGKTTTIYSTINLLNKEQNYNIMTIENPVEFQLEGVNQMQVQHEIGFTFAGGLKAILRLSPDIVFVGEIRDKETAEIAVESGLTGQLVLSTLHAEDSIGALYRLLDLGIESYLLNSSLMGIVAQRLVRENCEYCKKPHQPEQSEIDLFQQFVGKIPAALFASVGCKECNFLGFKGRIGIFEVLEMNAKVRSLIRKKLSEEELRAMLIGENLLTTLLKDGLDKAESGLTTVAEVLRNSLRIV